MSEREPLGGDDAATGEGRLWGARFAQRPDAAAWALGQDNRDRRLWRADLAGSRAHADELRRTGVLGEADHSAIHRALDEVEAEFAEGRFAFHPDDEDLHGAIERRLRELAGEAGGRLRAGRSRNDQIARDLKLYLAEEITHRLGELRAVQRALVDQAERAVDWLAPGYTHLQRAQPVTLGHHLLAHAWALERDAERLAGARERALAQSPLGSGALAGLTLELDPARYAAALGYDGPAPNSIDAIADRDTAVEFLAAAAMLGVHLSRLGEEVVLWASGEFGWVRVGDAFSTGSSIMPQKRNPDTAELVRGKSGRLIGDLVSLLVVLKGLPLAYNRDLQEDKAPVLDAVDTLALTLPATAGMVASLEFDRERLASTAAGGFALATDLAEALVRRGVPVRTAHERVGEAVRQLEAEGADIAGLAPARLAELLPELVDAHGAIDPDLADAAAAVARRAASLGPAPQRVTEQAAALRARIDAT